MRLAIAPDEPGRLRALIEEGLTYDLLLLTGGVSMGKYDLVEQVLAELNAEFYFTGAEIQPGKPIVFGSCGGKSISLDFREIQFPPWSHSSFLREPMIEALTGAQPQPLIFPRARLKSEIRTKKGLTRFLPAVLSGNSKTPKSNWRAGTAPETLLHWSRELLFVIPPDREKIDAGEWVPLLMRCADLMKMRCTRQVRYPVSDA